MERSGHRPKTAHPSWLRRLSRSSGCARPDALSRRNVRSKSLATRRPRTTVLLSGVARIGHDGENATEFSIQIGTIRARCGMEDSGDIES